MPQRAVVHLFKSYTILKKATLYDKKKSVLGDIKNIHLLKIIGMRFAL